MKFIKATTICAAFLGCMSAMAGTGTHGGDAIICDENGQSKVYVLDYFEAENTTRLTIDFGPNVKPTDKYNVRVQAVLERLEKIDPKMAQVYMQRLATFEQDAAFIDRATVPELDDSKENIAYGRNCKKMQFAVQVLWPKQFDKRYLIDKVLWDAADETQKAGLVLHEIILPEAVLSFEHKDTSLIRYYNAVISSAEFNLINPRRYIQILKESRFYSSGYFVHSIVSNGVAIYGRLGCGESLCLGSLWSKENSPIEQGTINAGKVRFSTNCSYDNRTAVYNSGIIGSGYSIEDVEAQMDDQTFKFRGGCGSPISVSESGFLTSGILKQPTYFQFDDTNKLLLINSECRINKNYYYSVANVSFSDSETGAVLSATVHGTYKLKTPQGSLVKLSGYNRVEFNDKGELVNYEKVKCKKD